MDLSMCGWAIVVMLLVFSYMWYLEDETKTKAKEEEMTRRFDLCLARMSECDIDDAGEVVDKVASNSVVPVVTTSCHFVDEMIVSEQARLGRV
jgi:hypothetical protein